MIKSFREKVKTLIFSSESDERQIKTGTKRKRPSEDSDDLDTDEQHASVKKPRLQPQNSSQSGNLIQKILSSSIVQNMSDWVQRTTSNVWRSDPGDAAHDRLSGGNGFSQRQYRSDALEKTDSNGGTHHRFTRVDDGLSVAYTKGSWPVIQKHTSQPLSRRAIHSHATKSTTVQTDHISEDKVDGNGKGFKTRFEKLFKFRNKHKFSASESIRLNDKLRYKELLQQFTTVPLDPVDIPHSPVTVQPSVSVSQLPRFFCTNNDTILGSNLTTWQKQTSSITHKDRSTIKVHPDSKSTLKANTFNGTCRKDSASHITDISNIHYGQTSFGTNSRLSEEKFIDLTGDEEVQNVAEERSWSQERHQRTPQTNTSLKRVKSPNTFDYRDSKFISETWIQDLNNSYGAKARDRERKIAEEELRVKIMSEQRHKQEVDLERKIRKQLKIYAKEPPAIEEPEFIEIETSDEEEEEEEESLPELNNEMENKINNCLSSGPAGEVLVDRFRLQITRGDIKTLAGLNWLNDEIINFYMNLLMERGEKEGMPKVYAFNTFFYPKVISGGQSAVKRWTRRVDVLAVDYILIPVHLGMHWCLAVINLKQKDIQYYDSMGGTNTECLNALKKYLCDESMEKKKKPFDLSGWKFTTVKDIPHQQNGSDCGMFACKFADYITREKQFSFTQQHMPYFRRRMVYEIVTASLLQ